MSGYEQRSAIYWTGHGRTTRRNTAKVFFKLLEGGIMDTAAAPIAQHI